MTTRIPLKVRFGDDILEHGFTSVPTLFLENYAQMGISDAAAMFVIHLLKFKWDERNPYPRIPLLPMSGNDDTRRRYLREYRKLGLIFTRRLRHTTETAPNPDLIGRVRAQEYDLESLFYNVIRVANAPRNAEFTPELPIHIVEQVATGKFHDVPKRIKTQCERHYTAEQHLDPRLRTPLLLCENRIVGNQSQLCDFQVLENQVLENQVLENRIGLNQIQNQIRSESKEDPVIKQNDDDDDDDTPTPIKTTKVLENYGITKNVKTTPIFENTSLDAAKIERVFVHAQAKVDAGEARSRDGLAIHMLLSGDIPPEPEKPRYTPTSQRVKPKPLSPEEQLWQNVLDQLKLQLPQALGWLNGSVLEGYADDVFTVRVRPAAKEMLETRLAPHIKRVVQSTIGGSARVEFTESRQKALD